MIKINVMNNGIQRAGAALVVLAGLIFFSSCGASKNMTNSAAAQELSKSIDSSNWTFTVQQVRPQQGSSTIPNGNYSVIYKPGNLNVYLPYLGRAFGGADLLLGQSPLNFISKNFEVEKQPLKQGKWRIIFKPTDQTQVQSMTFILFSSGSGSLNIIMTNRSPISYSGTLSANK
jgi:hypothetical protein